MGLKLDNYLFSGTYPLCEAQKHFTLVGWELINKEEEQIPNFSSSTNKLELFFER